MNHGAESGTASEEDALSLRTRIFAAMGVAVVLCFSIYSFIAVGHAFEDRECGPACSPAGDGRFASAEDFSDGPDTFICQVVYKDETVTSVWDEDKDELIGMWDRDGLFVLNGRVLTPEERDALR